MLTEQITLPITGIFVFITTCQNQKKENLKSSESAQEENHFDFPDSLSARIISFVPNLKRDFPKNTRPDNSYAQ